MTLAIMSFIDSLQSTLSDCLDDVSDWMRSNRLQLNASKTEILWCSTSRRRHLLPTTAVRVGVDYVTPSAVRDLGIIIIIIIIRIIIIYLLNKPIKN